MLGIKVPGKKEKKRIGSYSIAGVSPTLLNLKQYEPTYAYKYVAFALVLLWVAKETQYSSGGGILNKIGTCKVIASFLDV